MGRLRTKALALVARRKLPVRTHDLTALLAHITAVAPVKIKDAIEELKPHYLLPRYPDMAFAPTFHFSYNRAAAKRLLRLTKLILLWLEKQLEK